MGHGSRRGTKPTLAVLVACALIAIGIAAAPGPAAGQTDPVIADPVIAAAGDIACRSTQPTATTCHQRATSDLLLDDPDDPDDTISRVLALGDEQYETGALADFRASYDPTWGRREILDKTSPVPGNHEYKTPGARGYFDYFGDRADPSGLGGYYSFNLGSWHLIALNSNIAMAEGTPQNNWLEQDLAADTSKCTLAYMHHPRFSSGVGGNTSKVRPLWADLYIDRTDVVLAGHEHSYERFAPQTPTGRASTRGIRQFVVGTGGVELKPLGTPKPNSEVFQGTTFGVLRLTLHATSYEWRFQPEVGGVFTEVGSGQCV